MIAKHLSIRARVALALLSLESLLKHKTELSDTWKWLLAKLWNYTNIQYLDDWHEEMAEYIPSTIVEYEAYEPTDFDFLDSCHFKQLKKLYQESDNAILEVVNLVFDIGTLELYGALKNNGIQSLKELDKVINILNIYEIKLPNYPFLEGCSFEEENGWGKKFTRSNL